MLKRMKLWMAIALVIACGVVLTACAPDPGLPTKNEKTMEEACVQSIQALMSGDSYCILYEQEFSNVVRKTEYRRYEQDQLVLALEDSTQENRIFADGKYGEANGIGWVWEDDRPNYDANEWLREWSPEYMETTNWTSSDRTVSFNAVWDNPLNPQRQCSGQLTYTFNENWVLESVHREYVVLEGIGQVGGSIETITVLDEPPEKTMALIDSVARRCVAKEETRQLAIRQQVKVGSVDELLAAIAPNREIILEPGTYDLGQATDYGTGREGAYYFWEDMSDGYELVIRGVSNLMIRGAGMHSTNIETLPRYADVLNFQECSDITLSDFTAGHTDGYGECGAGVVYLYDCTNVNLSKLGLYGCGCVGLTTEYCGNVSLRDSDIYDCSSSAAVLRNSHWAEIVDCRIYRIGHELYGGYCIFETTECEDVMIDGCEIYDSRTSSLLCAANNQYDVIMKNNMIRNNRFEEAAMVLQGCSATMENNQFKDNSIRNWYKRSSNMAEDGNNKTLTEDILNEMYGAKPGEPVSPQLEIHVSTADEFLAAIGPNKRIVLDARGRLGGG